jgi:hypothetical protein
MKRRIFIQANFCMVRGNRLNYEQIDGRQRGRCIGCNRIYYDQLIVGAGALVGLKQLKVDGTADHDHGFKISIYSYIKDAGNSRCKRPHGLIYHQRAE